MSESSDDQKAGEELSLEALTELKILALEWSTRLEFCEMERNRLVEFNQRSKRMLHGETDKRVKLENELTKVRSEREQVAKTLEESKIRLQECETERQNAKSELCDKTENYRKEIEHLGQTNAALIGEAEKSRLAIEEFQRNLRDLRAENERLKLNLDEFEKKNEDLQNRLSYIDGPKRTSIDRECVENSATPSKCLKSDSIVSPQLHECLHDAGLKMMADLIFIKNLQRKLVEIEASRDGYMNLAASISDALAQNTSSDLKNNTEHVRFLLSETIAARTKLKSAQRPG